MRLGIFAAVKIKKGEEITYDYAFQYDYAEYVGGGAHPCLGPFVSDQPFCAPFFAFLLTGATTTRRARGASVTAVLQSAWAKFEAFALYSRLVVCTQLYWNISNQVECKSAYVWRCFFFFLDEDIAVSVVVVVVMVVSQLVVVHPPPSTEADPAAARAERERAR
jgi:hypothetical protein